MNIGLWIIEIIIIMFIMYIVIRTAVKDGINKSVIGEYFDNKYDIPSEKPSFLDRDLDQD